MTDEVRPTRVGVVVVHGIGDQTPGTTVRQVGEPLHDAVAALVQAEGGTLSVEHVLDELGGMSTCFAMHVTNATGACRIDVRESRWAERFAPARFGEMRPWLPRAGWRISGRLRRAVLDAAKVLDATISEARGVLTAFLAKAHLTWLERPLNWLFPRITRFIALLRGGVYAVAFATVGLLVLGAALIPLAALLLVLASLWKATSGRAAAARSALSSSIGDAFVLENRLVERAAMVQQVRADVTAAAADADHIVVIAHSLGAVIAHEALEPCTAPVRQLITLGSGFVPVGVGKQKGTQIRRVDRLEQIPWLDLFAPFDVVAGGRLETTEATGAPMASVGVINHSSLLRDHPGYFANVEQVMAVTAERVLDLGATPAATTEDTGAVARARRDRRLRVGVAAELRGHRKRAQSMLTGTYVLGTGAAILATTRDWQAAIGARLVEWADTPLKVVPDQIEDRLRSWSTSEGGSAMVGLAFLAVVAVLVARIAVVGSWQRWDEAAAGRLAEPASPDGPVALYRIRHLLHAAPVAIGPVVGVVAIAVAVGDGRWDVWTVMVGVVLAALAVLIMAARLYAVAWTSNDIMKAMDVIAKESDAPVRAALWTSEARPAT